MSSRTYSHERPLPDGFRQHRLLPGLCRHSSDGASLLFALKALRGLDPVFFPYIGGFLDMSELQMAYPYSSVYRDETEGKIGNMGGGKL